MRSHTNEGVEGRIFIQFIALIIRNKIYTALQGVLGASNSLDSGATTKITINNRRWNKADFEQTILIPMADDDLDKYRKIGMKIRNEAKGGMLVASIVGVDMRATMDPSSIEAPDDHREPAFAPALAS